MIYFFLRIEQDLRFQQFFEIFGQYIWEMLRILQCQCMMPEYKLMVQKAWLF